MADQTETPTNGSELSNHDLQIYSAVTKKLQLILNAQTNHMMTVFSDILQNTVENRLAKQEESLEALKSAVQSVNQQMFNSFHPFNANTQSVGRIAGLVHNTSTRVKALEDHLLDIKHDIYSIGLNTEEIIEVSAPVTDRSSLKRSRRSSDRRREPSPDQPRTSRFASRK